MAKGYWIARVDVTDEALYPKYLEANRIAFAKYGARYLVRGGNFTCAAGKSRARNVVLEFKDYATAVACFESEEYRVANPIREAAAVADLIIIEGYDGWQPGD